MSSAARPDNQRSPAEPAPAPPAAVPRRPPAGRSATRRGQRTRAAIVSAATRLFARHGYRGAPLAAVADAVELTQPGLLHHFSSKEELLMAVLEERDNEAKRRMGEDWFRGGRESLSILEDLVAHNAGTPQLVQLFTVLVGEAVSAGHPAHGFFIRRYAHLRERTTRAVRQGQRAGEFRDDVDPERVASLILAAMDGLQIQWLLDPDIDMPTHFSLLIRMVDRYLSVEPALPA